MNEYLSDDERARLQAADIPVDSFNPGTHWIMCVDSESQPLTDDEMAMFLNYRWFVMKKIFGGMRAEELLGNEPLGKATGYITAIFIKGRGPRHPERAESWSYRLSSWGIEDGIYQPDVTDPTWRTTSLGELLDHIERRNADAWEAWKSRYPDLYPLVNA